jgi:hypothetical protein
VNASVIKELEQTSIVVIALDLIRDQGQEVFKAKVNVTYNRIFSLIVYYYLIARKAISNSPITNSPITYSKR